MGRLEWNRQGNGTTTVFVDNLPLSTTVPWIWKVVWGCRVKLSKAKYVRSKSAQGRVDPKDNAKQVWRQVSTEMMGKEAERGHKTRAYKDVLVNGRKDIEVVSLRNDNNISTLGTSKLMLETDISMVHKLNRSLVGETIAPIDFKAMREAIMRD
ncbi:hypothetical protein PIB30_072332 [Stylosanthes scabra]|uniref:Uncharacterized protein n=1 Tax=Stylosanthes scabra TaxID=79078 RepID=A0ABU6VQ43_9FABA|nr:hypothetical protein [Stylosanthes scabra]